MNRVVPSHITATCKSANYQLYCLNRIKHYLSPDTLKTAVHALIYSKLDYCNSLLVGLPIPELSKFQHVLNSAACMITGTRKFHHIKPVLIDLHWLPVDHCVKFKLLCLTHKALHGLAPRYISNLLQLYSPPRSLRSSEHELLCILKACAKKYGERAFAHAACKLYNELPLITRLSANLNVFKNCLKTHLFKLAYEAELP